LAVMLSLEAIAGEFFARVTGFAQRLGLADLRYFGPSHLAAERDHGVFGEDCASEFAAIKVPASAVAETRVAVERTFAAMTQFADDLDGAMSSAARSRLHIGA
jgi:hypothetical protein